jgi:1-acyl-sn-glycerol-3-phosphate acyltransferase
MRTTLPIHDSKSRMPQVSESSSAPHIDRDGLIEAIVTFLSGQPLETLRTIRVSLEQAIDAAGADALAALNRGLANAGADWSYYPADPLARHIHRVLADHILEPGSTLEGVEHVLAAANAPVVLLANHLSYSDANLLEVLLYRAGGAAASDRLTVVAGPKVYSSLKRRFSSLCFGTIKTPQSSAVSSEDAVMNAREVARAARRSIEIAHERLRAGDALLVFAEGTRSRSNGLQPLLPAVTRYLDLPGTQVLPVAITGTEVLFPIGDDTLHPVRAVVRIGPPIDVEALRESTKGDRRVMVDAMGFRIAGLLPEPYRGAYADEALGVNS